MSNPEKKFGAPYLGAAYYPEAWPREQIAADLDALLEHGLNTVRIGEFAWAQMEPEEGKYDLSLFREVVDACRARGISVIMCTPSATLPAWLEAKYPDACALISDRRTTHGTRRLSCPTNPAYRAAIRGVVEALGREFGGYENIIGWQIDNEIGVDNPDGGCICPTCTAAWRNWLREKYRGDVRVLNEVWDNRTWSMWYSDFEEIPALRNNAWFNATHRVEWAEYKNDVYLDFIREQAEILRKYTKAPIGTDMMPTQQFDMERVNRELDVMQFNHYSGPEAVTYWLDLCRNLQKSPAEGGKRFWVTETSTCYNGSNVPGGPRRRGFCRANSLAAFAAGAEANLYWLFRQHRAGHEIAHGSVIDAWGRDLPVGDELRAYCADVKKIAPILNRSTVAKNGIAVVCGHLPFEHRRYQALASHADDAPMTAYGRLASAHLRPDVIPAGADLTPYKLIISAGQYTLEEGDFDKHILPWVEAGGTWVVEPLTDVLTPEAIRYRNAPFGHLEDWAHVTRIFSQPAPHADDRYAGTMPVGELTDIDLIGDAFRDAPLCKTDALLYDALVPSDDNHVRVLGRYAPGGDEYLTGLAAITETKVGRGRIILLGARPDAESYVAFLTKIAAECGISPLTAGSGHVRTSLLVGDVGRVFTAIESSGKPGEFVLVPFTGVDLFTGRRFEAGTCLPMPPYECVFIREDA